MSQTVERQRIHDIRFPNESPEYRDARDRLLEAEIELRRQTERVAALRRALPAGGKAKEDYVFEEGDDAAPVRLSALFGDKAVLLLYSYMYGSKMARPCPSCTSILDSLDRQVHHITQRAALAVAARSPIDRIVAFTRPRGWTQLRIVSSANNTYAQDYHSETPSGSQLPILNIFSRDADGTIRHRWASELAWAPTDPGQDPRHVDALWPLWGAFDFSPDGRGDFHPKLEYD